MSRAERSPEVGALCVRLVPPVVQVYLPAGLEDVIKLLLERAAVLQRPAALLLMAEHHAVQDRTVYETRYEAPEVFNGQLFIRTPPPGIL